MASSGNSWRPGPGPAPWYRLGPGRRAPSPWDVRRHRAQPEHPDHPCERGSDPSPGYPACRSGPTPLRARRRRWSPRPPYLPLRSKPQSARREKPRPRRQSEYAFCFPCRLPFQQNSLLSDLRPTFRLCHDHNLPQSDSKRNPFFPAYGKIFLQCCLKDTKVPPKRKRIKRIDQGLAFERPVDF